VRLSRAMSSRRQEFMIDDRLRDAMPTDYNERFDLTDQPILRSHHTEADENTAA
jgi:hypothetical protein